MKRCFPILLGNVVFVITNCSVGPNYKRPVVEACLSGFLGGQSISSLFNVERTAWNLPPQFTQPLFTAGRLRSNVKFAKAERERAPVAILQDRLRLAYVRYRGGVDTQLNALDADRDLFQAELNLARIRLDESLTVVELYKALGGGLK